MTSKKLTINENFWLNFSKVYEKPSLVNKYLADYSDEIEKIVITNFNKFNLSSEYSIYANGGFGRREMFPSSDVDLSIVQHNKNAKNMFNKSLEIDPEFLLAQKNLESIE